MSDLGEQEAAVLRAAAATAATTPVVTQLDVAGALGHGGKAWDPRLVGALLEGLVERGYLAAAPGGSGRSTPAGDEPGYVLTSAGRAVAGGGA